MRGLNDFNHALAVRAPEPEDLVLGLGLVIKMSSFGLRGVHLMGGWSGFMEPLEAQMAMAW